MTDEAPPPEPEQPRGAAPRPVRPRRTAAGWVLIASVGLVLLVAAVAAGLRYGVLLPQARLLIEAQASGVRIGRFGRLHIEGLQGDIWRHFTLRRLTVADEGGVWLDARNLDVDWRYEELLSRRLHVTDLVAGQLILVRRPTLTPAGVDRGLPVSFRFDHIRTPVEMRPAFSYQRGAYRLEAALTVARRGGAAGRAHADSLMHAGDFVDLTFDVGRGNVLQLQAHAREANGGAVAGSLGLAADQPFLLDATMTGTTSQGRFTVVSRSGAITPLQAAGSWTPAGGRAHGQLLVSSSTLLQRQAIMFGPTARFDITGDRAPDGLYDFNGRITAPNLQLTANGKADIGRRITGPQGVLLDASIGEVSHLLSWPDMADGHARGRLVGTGAHWTFTGDASINRVGFVGLTLASVGGPITVERLGGETNVDGRIVGAGGRGEGLVAGMLGARPAAEFSSTWTHDGRLLLRRVLVHGPGVLVDGAGTRGVLGDLGFSGTARVTNFAFTHSGATGLVDASWTAHQARGTDPWSFTADARGQHFALGLGELDRLLGTTPHFRGSGLITHTGVTLTNSTLDGQAGSTTGGGTISNALDLQLALTWRASGPFHAGPVELSGDVHGDGRVTGTILHPRLNLNATLNSIDMPVVPLRDAHVALIFQRGDNNVDGTINVAATSQYGPARGTAAFNFRPDGVALTNVDVDAGGIAAQGSIDLTRGRPSQAELTYTIGPGVFLLSGTATGRAHIADSPAGAAGRITLQANDAVTRGGIGAHFLSVEATGPVNHLGLKLSGESGVAGLWRFAGTGTMVQTQAGYDIGLNLAGRVRRADFRTTEANIQLAGDNRTARLQMTIGGGGADINIRQIGQTLNAHAVLRSADLGLIDEDLAGRFNADITLAGQGASLSGDMNAQLQDAHAAGSRDPSMIAANVRAHLAGDSITLDATAQDGEGLHSRASLVLPAEAAANPFRIAIARHRPMRGTFAAQGEIAPLWTLLMGGERSLGGQVDMSGELAGSLADPRATGTATITAGRFTDARIGLRLTNLGFRATLANNAIDVADLTGQDGGRGRVTGSGRISLLRNGLSSFRLGLQGFRLLDNEIGQVVASGDATINRDATGRVQLLGALTVDRAEIAANPPTPPGVVTMAVREINRPVRAHAAPAWEQPPPAPLAVGLDVTLRAPRAVFVRGRGLNLELAVDSHVTGTTATPVLTGMARVVRGDYDLAGRRFQFDTRGTVSLSTRPEQIRLDLTATRDDPSLTASVKITGTAAHPHIELTSTPALPQDEILARVLFGTSEAQLSPYEAAQLASSLAALAGGGGLDVIGNLRSLANLDRLAIGGTQVTGVTVSGGRYITDNVYVELTGGGREGPSAQVEWRVRRSLSLISRLRGQGDASLSVRWRRDY